MESSSEADVVQLFQATPITQLPAVTRVHDNSGTIGFCMPVPGRIWLYILLWKLVPRRLRRCRCWYHRGDWRAAAEIALQALNEAEAAGVAPDDVLSYIGSVMRRLELDSWTDKAAKSFFVQPITIGTESDGTEKLPNGQHRTWLMREAGAPTTIIAIDVEP